MKHNRPVNSGTVTYRIYTQRSKDTVLFVRAKDRLLVGDHFRGVMD